MNEKMERALHATLRPGESILWQSGTQPFRITDGKEGRRTLLCWLAETACIVAIAAFFAANDAATARFLALMLLLLALVLFSPLLSYRQLLEQHYVITQERALLLRGDGSVYAMERGDIGTFRIYPMEFGGASLALGDELLEEKDRQLRWRANHPKESADQNGVNTVRGMVFYHVERAEEALRLLLSAGAKGA